MNFIDLAEYNERLVAVSMETENDIARLSLYKKIAAGLAQLQMAYEESVSEEHIPQLTAADIALFRNTDFIDADIKTAFRSATFLTPPLSDFSRYATPPDTAQTITPAAAPLPLKLLK